MTLPLPRSLLLSAQALLAAALTLACGGPEGPGDECEPADDECPDGLVCAASGDGHTCQIPAGASCSPGKEDYCVGEMTCGDDGTGTNTCGLPPGASCDETADPDECRGEMICGENHEGEATCGISEGGACDPAEPYCAGGLTCAEINGGDHACYPPVLIEGRVFDATSDEAIEAAQIIGLDEQATAQTDIAESDVEGAYVLEVPVARDAEGVPEQGVIFTLRASAADYQTFPGGLRTALPIQSDEAVSDERGWVISSALTDIALIPLPASEQGLPSISGAVVAGEDSGGVLVVAESGGGSGSGISAVSDRAGTYTIFNVPDGSYTVRGYAAGLQLDTAGADVSGSPLEGVDLHQNDAALGTIEGSLNIVNAFGGAATSVVLVVDSTFSDTFVRGEVPRGLRTPLVGAPDVTDAFRIDGVPEGSYVVLAAFENDRLVRDPDTNIAGTGLVRVQMSSPGTTQALSEAFKITEALDVVSPGSDEPEAVSSAPALVWADDSSEDYYTVVVYDAYGELVWEDQNVPGVSGADTVSVSYGGPLTTGMYYQFRATSWRAPGGGNASPIAATEDLRGVFYYTGG